MSTSDADDVSRDDSYSSYQVGFNGGPSSINDDNDGIKESSGKPRAVAPAGGLSVLGATFIVINACIGAGLLNFPKSYEGAGIADSLVIQSVMVVFIGLGLLVIAHASDINPAATTYQATMDTVCGWKGRLLCGLCVALYSFGGCITFLIVAGDQLDKIVESIVGQDYYHQRHWFIDRKFVITCFACFIVFPLCLPKKIDFLKYPSSLGVLGSVYVTVVAVARYYSGQYQPGPVRPAPQSWTSVFVVLPTICFGFQCHLSSIPVYACLRDRSLANYSKVVALVIFLSFTIYTVVGIYGFLTFGSSVNSDLLLSYDAHDTMVTVARVMITISVLTSYPILAFCGRTVLEDHLTQCCGPPAQWSSERGCRLAMTLVWFLCSLLLALFTPGIGEAIAVIGSLAAVFIFTFPGLCLIQLALKWPSGRAHLDLLKLTVGSVFLVMGGFVFGESLTMSIVTDLHLYNPY